MNYLPNSDLKVLRALKKAQRTEKCYVCLSTPGSDAHHMRKFGLEEAKRSVQEEPPVKISVSDDSLDPSLDALVEEGLIRKPSNFAIYQVTHAGWYHRQIRAKEIVHAVVTHFLFPAGVAFLTTLLTNHFFL